MSIPHSLRLALAWTLTAAAITSCSTRSSQSLKASVALFNGHDLAGWTAITADASVPQSDVWSVRDGMIVCQGEPLGFLRTDASYLNFRLEIEYRWAPGKEPGNSGLFSRIEGDDKPLPKCVEVQLMHGSAGDVLGLQGRTIAPDQPRHFQIAKHPLAGDIDGVRKAVAAERPPGEWNHVSIEANGPDYVVWLNGTEVNRVTGVETTPGPIGLQSEGGEIHFRNPRLIAR